MALFYYKYNNYNNRRLKREENLENYAPYLVYSEVNPNFNPGDGVSTQITVGRDQNSYLSNADYVIYSQSGTDITSRWFIMESHFNRGGQFILNLYRDVVVDFYDEILNADTFIEKAILPDNDPLIFNKENMSVNQIKKAEYLLRDVTQTAWIIGYIPRNFNEGQPKNIKLQSMDVIADIDLGDKDINTWDYYPYVTGFGGNEKLYGAGGNNIFYFEVLKTPIGGTGTQYQTWRNYTKASTSYEPNPYLDIPVDYTAPVGNAFDTWVTNNKTDINSIVSRYRDLYFDVKSQPTLYNEALKLDGQVIKASSIYYKITINQKGTEDFRVKITNDKSGDYLLTWLKNKFSEAPHSGNGSPTFLLQAFYQNLTITLEEIGASTDTYTVDIPGIDDRLHLKDAPYDMFCIPYMSGSVNDTYNSVQTEQTKAQVLNVVQSMAQQIGKDNLYDLQLVPYSPMTGFEGFYDSGKDRVDLYFKGTDKKRTTYIKTSGGKDAIPIFWATASSGNLSIRLKGITEEVISKKMASECYMARLVSPNYNGQFEFNPAKLDFNPNGLTPTLFNVDFTFIPYNPFIRVSPIFGGLYGSTFTDARGLLVGGDMSIAYLSDAWVNYQIQNKNYNNIFDREVENLETQYKYQNIQNYVSGAVGVLQGAVSGGVVGSMGGGIGTVAGAVAGGVASAAGAVADITITKKLQEENLNYKTDLFGYQLDNIKALPNSIAKTTAYNSINKIFPSLEMYECTDEEKKAVANKVAWNSMSVGVIGKITDYIGNSFSYKDVTDKGYIKGKIIRLEGANDIDDTHLQAIIVEEINKGWYFK